MKKMLGRTPRAPRLASQRTRRSLGMQLLLAVGLSSPAAAQFPEFPTLSGAGLEYISNSGLFQLFLSGQLDLEGLYVAHSWDAALAPSKCDACHTAVARGLRQGEGALRTHRLRVFADIFLGDHLDTHVELRGDRGWERFDVGTKTRVEPAYARVTSGSGVTGVQAGRFATPFGAYPMRHLTTSDYFLRPPLAYEYRTVMNRWSVPGNTQGFLRWKDA